MVIFCLTLCCSCTWLNTAAQQRSYEDTWGLGFRMRPRLASDKFFNLSASERGRLRYMNCITAQKRVLKRLDWLCTGIGLHTCILQSVQCSNTGTTISDFNSIPPTVPDSLHIHARTMTRQGTCSLICGRCYDNETFQLVQCRNLHVY